MPPRVDYTARTSPECHRRNLYGATAMPGEGVENMTSLIPAESALCPNPMGKWRVSSARYVECSAGRSAAKRHTTSIVTRRKLNGVTLVRQAGGEVKPQKANTLMIRVSRRRGEGQLPPLARPFVRKSVREFCQRKIGWLLASQNGFNNVGCPESRRRQQDFRKPIWTAEKKRLYHAVRIS